MKRQNALGFIRGGLAVLLGTLLASPSGAFAATSVTAGDLPTVIKGIDVVGVPASQVGALLQLLGLKEGMQVPYRRLKEAVVTPAEAKLEGTGRFREISVRPTTFIGGSEDGATYLTISVVDRSSHRAKAAPRAARELPSAVVAFFDERVRGLGAFRDTLLPSDQDRLEDLAERHAAALEAALDASQPEIRARAAQAIAFLPDSRQARRLLEGALLDPDAGMRRDVARALLPLVERQIGREPIALEPYLALIRLPESADRMNAASLLLRLARIPEGRAPIIREAGAPLLAMAKMKHPGERTLALEALQVLSQAPAPKSWDEYRNWWERASAQRFAE
ncbi:hypothetical protein D3C72_109690 [compost metagenome]